MYVKPMRCEGNPGMHRPNVQSHAKACVPQIDFPGVCIAMAQKVRRAINIKSLCAPTRNFLFSLRYLILSSVRTEVYDAGGKPNGGREGNGQQAAIIFAL